MTEKNSRLKFDDYSRRMVIPEKSKRIAFCKEFLLTEGKMYKILSNKPYTYGEKRVEQDNLRYQAWKNYGAMFENIEYTRN